MGSPSNKSLSVESKGSRDLPPNTASFIPTIFWQNQFQAKPVYPPPNTDLSGKTAIVTGANSGLGLECGRQLLSYNLSHLIIAVRSTEKGDRAARELRSKHRDADVVVWELDMASYPSIQAFVRRVETSLPRIDFVVLNAGLMNSFSIVPSTGHEEMFQVNYLSQALLTFLLLPVLKAKSEANSSGPAHVTWVNAALSLVAKFSNRNRDPIFPSLSEGPNGFDNQEGYNCSKVLAHYFVWKLADYVSKEDVIVTLTDPGYVRGTLLAKDRMDQATKKFGVFFKLFYWMFSRLGRKLEDGASTIVDALVNKGKETHGSFLMGWKVAPFAAMVYGLDGKEVRERLWNETVEEFKFADVAETLEIMKASKDANAKEV
ncbi:hypothetical protein N0V82_010389 [Gnomoniopsis sp. IMI 355080]|nr:hypothetical protein N0V82_010389 [Gnomoniopsis sp. IMI 355080]